MTARAKRMLEFPRLGQEVVAPKQITPQPNAIRQEAVNLGGALLCHILVLCISLPPSFLSALCASHVHNQCTQAAHKRRSGEQNPVMFKCHQGWPQLSAITNRVSSRVEFQDSPPCCGSILYLFATYTRRSLLACPSSPFIGPECVCASSACSWSCSCSFFPHRTWPKPAANCHLPADISLS